MPTDRELKQLAITVSKKLPGDPNRPYTVRRRVKGSKDSRGTRTNGEQYETRIIQNIRTQPLSDKELSRLPEGLKDVSWRFAEVVPLIPGELPSSPDEFLDFGDQLKYKSHWYEVKMINDWDLLQGCKMVFVE
jgi:hypothetical protein